MQLAKPYKWRASDDRVDLPQRRLGLRFKEALANDALSEVWNS
jgi:hypothetical protein